MPEDHIDHVVAQILTHELGLKPGAGYAAALTLRSRLNERGFFITQAKQ